MNNSVRREEIRSAFADQIVFFLLHFSELKECIVASRKKFSVDQLFMYLFQEAFSGIKNRFSGKNLNKQDHWKSIDQFIERHETVFTGEEQLRIKNMSKYEKIAYVLSYPHAFKDFCGENSLFFAAEALYPGLYQKSYS